MSKLEELIQELCPNGVEYSTFGEITNYEQPSKYIVNNTDYNDEYGIPVLTAGQTFVLGYTDETEGIYIASKNNPVIIFDDFTGAFKWVDFPFKVKSSAMKMIIADESKTILRYIYHVMGNIGFLSIEHKRLWISTYSAFKVPLPPLPIQREIVRILDNFTELTEELTAELTEELTARKKQYEFYRDYLLTFDDKIPKVRLKDIATDIFRGAGIKRDQVTVDGIPCVRYGEIYTTYNTWFDKCISHTQLDYVSAPKYFEYGDILFAITGESVEDIAKSVAYVGNEKCLAGGDIVVMKHEQNPKYLAYVLDTYDAGRQKCKGKIKSKVVHSSIPAIEEIVVPLPSLDIQERFVKVLDNFDAICAELNIGLPAEIEARKKQYEFYRDALLTFAETGEIIASKQAEYNALIKLCQYVFGFIRLPLGEISNVFRGEYITKKSTREGDVAVILGGQEPAYYIDKANHEGEIVVIARSGASAGFVSYWEQPIFVTDGFGYEAKEGLTTAKYLYYILKNMEPTLNAMKRGAGVPHVSGEALARIVLPIPPISEQKRIVSILDRFDTLCNDLTSGLPAEIEVRQKQYEYYRDKMLTFQPAE